jgi:hypothetical protein
MSFPSVEKSDPSISSLREDKLFQKISGQNRISFLEIRFFLQLRNQIFPKNRISGQNRISFLEIRFFLQLRNQIFPKNRISGKIS